MLKVCPQCGRLVTVEAEETICPYCGATIRVDPAELSARQGASGYTPWDDRERVGALRAYWLTWREVLTRPSEFFARQPLGAGISGPLLFALVTTIFANLAALFWQALFYSRNEVLQALLSEAGISLQQMIQMAVVLVPVYALIRLFVWGGILHLLIMLLARERRGFEATFRAVAYSTAPTLLYVVPVCGSIIADFWSLVLTIIGLREVHRVSGGVAALAVLIPVFTCLGALLVGVYASFSALSAL